MNHYRDWKPSVIPVWVWSIWTISFLYAQICMEPLHKLLASTNLRHLLQHSFMFHHDKCLFVIGVQIVHINSGSSKISHNFFWKIPINLKFWCENLCDRAYIFCKQNSVCEEFCTNDKHISIICKQISFANINSRIRRVVCKHPFVDIIMYNTSVRNVWRNVASFRPLCILPFLLTPKTKVNWALLFTSTGRIWQNYHIPVEIWHFCPKKVDPVIFIYTTTTRLQPKM